jgi:TPP-dependent pyruvate/acetoin dehydrogenase alpha subunit
MDEYEDRAKKEIDTAQRAAEAADYPAPEDALGAVYAPVEA